MKLRVLSGFVAAVLLIALIAVGTSQWVLSVCLLCSVLAVLEFDQMFFLNRSVARQLRMATFILLLAISLRHSAEHSLAVIWALFLSLSLWHVFTSNSQNAFGETTRSLGFEMFGCIYVVSIFGFLTPLFELPDGRYYVLLLFLVVSVGDTAAYFVGSRFGRRPLASKISPKKTIEGSMGALGASLLVALAWIHYVRPVGLEVSQVLLMAGVGSILAQAGDLLESILKRSQGAKDSGKFLPGHGGILDRTDGLALSAPVFYFFAKYAIGGGL